MGCKCGLQMWAVNVGCKCVPYTLYIYTSIVYILYIAYNKFWLKSEVLHNFPTPVEYISWFLFLNPMFH